MYDRGVLSAKSVVEYSLSYILPYPGHYVCTPSTIGVPSIRARARKKNYKIVLAFPDFGKQS